MQFRRIRIETANLEQGMYVAQLDRPWLETPFLHQGFEVTDAHLLGQLRHYCNYVFVDATRSSVPKERILAARSQAQHYAARLERRINGREHAPRESMASRLLVAVARLDPTGTLADRLPAATRRNTVTTANEAPRAVEAFDTATATMNRVLIDMRESRPLDVPAMKAAVAPLIDSMLRNQDAMTWLAFLRKRDERLQRNSVSNAVWALAVGRHLGFDRQSLDSLALGGLLLDLGKSKIPGSILDKASSLDTNEFRIVKKHVALSLDMVRRTPGINADVIAMIEGHHERHDGTGYPRGLKGNEIPVFGRIAGIVDSFDAMTTPRAYAPARSPYDAVRELNALAGIKFQRTLVEQFVQAMGMFPTGSLVELSGGEIAIVIEQNAQKRLRPRVMVLRAAAGATVAPGKVLDLHRLPGHGEPGKAVWIVRGLGSGAHGIDPRNYFP